MIDWFQVSDSIKVGSKETFKILHSTVKILLKGKSKRFTQVKGVISVYVEVERRDLSIKKENLEILVKFLMIHSSETSGASREVFK